MESLALTHPTLILIIGIPGAGKSFFAQKFSDMFGAPVVSIDRIRYELFAKPQYNADEDDLIGRLALYQIEELLKSKRSFVADGCGATKVERTQLAERAKQAGYDLLTIWVQTHEATAKGRSLKRSSRRQGDKYNTSLTPEQFGKLCRRFTAPGREDYMVISGMHTYSTQAKAVLRRLAKQHESKAAQAHRAEAEQLRQTTRADNSLRRSISIR